VRLGQRGPRRVTGVDGNRQGVRLRQAVLAAAELEPVVAQLRAELGLLEPYRDPGVAEFGLRNAVFGIGDGFLEVVSPASADTAAGRFLDRGRGGGYMLIFDLPELEAARGRAAELGIRVVWQIDLPDISGTHLHPADMAGTIVSIDRSRPFGTWRWGGPEWIGSMGKGAPGRLRSVTVAVPDPGSVAARWSSVLGVPSAGRELTLDRELVRFVEVADGDGQGLTEIELELPPQVRRGRDLIEVAGTRLRLVDGV
jgi:hypothetical protein